MRNIITRIVIVALLTSVGLITYAKGAFKNEELTREAWKALDDKNYPLVIVKAERCVTLFHEAALAEQNKLEREKMLQPLKGRVTDIAIKKQIFKRGLLNDVSTCWFILGKAHASDGDIEKAIKSFKKAMLFTYGRCYDSKNDTFWAPSDGAKAELQILMGKSIYD